MKNWKLKAIKPTYEEMVETIEKEKPTIVVISFHTIFFSFSVCSELLRFDFR